MVVNHIDKTFVTSDAATILKEVQPFPCSSKCSTPPPRCSSLHAKCRNNNAVMPPILPSPSLENCSAMLKT